MTVKFGSKPHAISGKQPFIPLLPLLRITLGLLVRTFTVQVIMIVELRLP